MWWCTQSQPTRRLGRMMQITEQPGLHGELKGPLATEQDSDSGNCKMKQIWRHGGGSRRGSSTFVCVVQLVSFFFFPKRDITPRMQNFEDISIFGNSSSFCAKRCVSILIWMQQERMLGGRLWDHHPLTGWAPLGNCCIFLHLIWKGCFGVLCFQSA